ncbi:MAG: hypothetical protein MJ194_06105 [Clostridia bacterium]|nr:hypothetical protein [Clostridia bacterium]
MSSNKDISDRWFKVWEEDDGFNIKAGARQDMIDIFFMEEDEEKDGKEPEKKSEK